MKAEDYLRVSPDEMKLLFTGILLKYGFDEAKALKCAEIFMNNSLEGVYSHGVNRFHRFVQYVKEGLIIPVAEPSLVHSSGSLEQWNGNLGPGPLNALFATGRAMELAEKHGIGLVALANTNHWMRGGTYGRYAAGKGFVFTGWTNTIANMPAWGATDTRLGNNPIVLAVPFEDEAIVLDSAMSQFSYGKLEEYELKGGNLPYPGGFDREGRETTNPSEILGTGRVMPAGYWKGAAMSLMLDITAAILSGGKSTSEVTRQKTESGVSQVFMAIHLRSLANFPSINETIRHIIDDYKNSVPVKDGYPVRYPGEKALLTRKDNMANGIPVNRKVWEQILSL